VKRVLTIVLTSLLVASATSGAASAVEADQTYIVVSKSGTLPLRALSSAELVSQSAAIGAAVVSMTESEATALAANPDLVVSPDGPIALNPAPPKDAERKPGGAPLPSSASTVDANSVRATRTAESWGIDRVDQRRGTNGTYNTRPEISGAGVHVYVIDTGLATWHPEFAGRVGNGVDFVGDGEGVQDCNGHGTHVTGTIASSIFGVAPGATVHPVRVLGCLGTGYVSDAVLGMNWIASNAPANAVANASMRAPYNAALNQAADNLVDTGTLLVVAAGNDADAIGNWSPASARRVTTVMATDIDDAETSYTNYGPQADIFAPGTDIWSTYYLDPEFSLRLSGTSMAAPHVAGYMALRLQTRPTESVTSSKDAMYAHSTKDVVDEYFPGLYRDDLLYTYAVAKPLKVMASAVDNRSRLRVDVDPSVGSASWRVVVQKKINQRWTSVATVSTEGTTEVVTVDFRRGTYRAVVPKGQFGYAKGVTSDPCTLRR
jgi:subtilisin family serine protease